MLLEKGKNRDNRIPGRIVQRLKNFLAHQGLALQLKKQPGKRQLEAFLKGLGSLMSCGFALSHALEFMAQDHQGMTQRVVAKLGEGQSFAQSLASFTALTQEDFESLKLAEETGRLTKEIQAVAKRLTEKRQLNLRLLGFCMYPLLMFVMILAYVFFALFFLVPMMANLLRSMNVTQGFLFQLDQFRLFLLDHGPLVIGVSLFVLGMILYLMKKKQGLLRLSMGKGYRLFLEMTYLRSLARLLRAGVGLQDSLRKLSHLRGIQSEVILKGLEDGCALWESMEKSGASKEVIRLTKLGEESGELLHNFESYCQQGQIRLESMMEKRIRLLEPLSLVLIGSLVGVCMVSIMGPLMDAFGKIR